MMLQKCHPVMKDVHVGNKRTKQNQGRNWVVQLEMTVRLVNMHVNVRQRVEIYKEHNTTTVHYIPINVMAKFNSTLKF